MVAPCAAAPAITFPDIPKCSDETKPGTVCQVAASSAFEYSVTPLEVLISRAGAYLDVGVRVPDGATYSFGDRPFLCCDVQGYMAPDGAGTWRARLKIPRIDEAVLTFRIANVNGNTGGGASFVGPSAHRDVVSEGPMDMEVNGVRKETLVSEIEGESRPLYVYRGKTCREPQSRCPVLYAADGGNVIRFILTPPKGKAGLLDRVVVVGIEGGKDEALGPRRMAELLKGVDAKQYETFQDYVIREVLPRVEGEGARSQLDRWTVGMSNGATWALDTAETHPDLFKGALVFSLARDPHDAVVPSSRLFFGAGTLEGGFDQTTRDVAASLRTSGAQVAEQYPVGGHSLSTWNTLFWWALDQIVGNADSRSVIRSDSK